MMIEFKKAYLKTINVKIFTFVESVIGTKAHNISMWSATNIVRGITSSDRHKNPQYLYMVSN